VKIKIFDNKWHKINFNKLSIKLSLFKLANLDFYNKFYKEFFFRYNSFEDLSLEWKKNKLQVTKILEKTLPKNINVLSYGCGIGFIEKHLVENRRDLNLNCFDFSDVASTWLRRDFKHIYFTADHEKLKKYDFIFMVGLLYAMNDLEIIHLLKKIMPLLKDKGKILTIDTSSEESENGIEIQNPLLSNFIKNIKNLIRPLYYFFFKKKEMQFWGYERNKESYDSIFEKAGLTNYRSFCGNKQLIQIFEVKKNNI